MCGSMLSICSMCGTHMDDVLVGAKTRVVSVGSSACALHG